MLHCFTQSPTWWIQVQVFDLTTDPDFLDFSSANIDVMNVSLCVSNISILFFGSRSAMYQPTPVTQEEFFSN